MQQKKITEQFIKFHSRTGSLLQFTGLMKILAHETTPPLRNLTVLPLLLSQDRDETIFHLTEGRIPVFSHDLVPDYLRTKLEPVTEERLHGYEHKVNIVARPQGAPLPLLLHPPPFNAGSS